MKKYISFLIFCILTLLIFSSVGAATATLKLRALYCEEPATSFGDDIDVQVDGLSIIPFGQFPIDEGQSYNLGYEYKFEGQCVIGFYEDRDFATSLDITEDMAGRDISDPVEIRIKEDGIYWLYFTVVLPVINLEENTDRPGMDYKSYYLSSPNPQLCANDCAKDPNCKAFTYGKPGNNGPNSRPECWLKYAVPNPVSKNCCVSGKKSGAEATNT